MFKLRLCALSLYLTFGHHCCESKCDYACVGDGDGEVRGRLIASDTIPLEQMCKQSVETKNTWSPISFFKINSTVFF